MQKRRRLKPDAVPTLFDRPGSQQKLFSKACPSGTVRLERYDIMFPNTRKGDTLYGKFQSTQHTVSPECVTIITSKMCDVNFMPTGYIQDLMKETLRRCNEGIIETLPSNTPGHLSSQYERPDKSIAIESHRSRFSL